MLTSLRGITKFDVLPSSSILLKHVSVICMVNGPSASVSCKRLNVEVSGPIVAQNVPGDWYCCGPAKPKVTHKWASTMRQRFKLSRIGLVTHLFKVTKLALITIACGSASSSLHVAMLWHKHAAHTDKLRWM